MTEGATERLRLEHDLHGALTRQEFFHDNSPFSLFLHSLLISMKFHSDFVPFQIGVGFELGTPSLGGVSRSLESACHSMDRQNFTYYCCIFLSDF
jgi:hypothetical protein